MARKASRTTFNFVPSSLRAVSFGTPRQHAGFTIVELLIVVVVIAILAAITIVSYNGIQQRARDVQRISAMRPLQGALEMYYTQNGGYPNICFSESGTPLNSQGTGQHCEVSYLASALVPRYIDRIPDLSMLPEHQRVYYAAGAAGSGSQYRMYAMAYGDGNGPNLSPKCRVTSPGLSPGDPGYSHFSPSGTAIAACY